MTGIFVRIRTPDGWRSVEIEDISPAQWSELEHQYPLDGWRWARELARWIRERVTAREQEGESTTERTEITEGERGAGGR